MYYSSMKAELKDCHFEQLKVAVSEYPTGPFEYCKTLLDTFSIDAHVIKDERGEFYLFYSTNEYNGISFDRPGTVVLVDRLIDMYTLEGKPRLAVRPTLDEEIFERNRFGDGRDWHTVEGAFFFSSKGRYYLMYSANAYTNEHYFIGYSVSDDGHSWSKFPDEYTYHPLLSKNDSVEGVGHNCVIKAPNNIDDWIVYHGRDIGKTFGNPIEQRMMRIDPLYWNGLSLWTPGPTYTEQDAPELPAFRDLFEYSYGIGLGEGWKINDGSWVINENKVCQNALNTISSAVVNLEMKNYIFEISLKWERSHMGGLYGVFAFYKDAANNLQVLLDAGKRRMFIISFVNGIRMDEKTVEINKEFKFNVFHRLRVIKVGDFYRVYLDDILMTEVYYLSGKGRIGMVTCYTCASFAGVELTNHVELDEACQSEFVKYLKLLDNSRSITKWNIWNIKNGSLLCDSSKLLTENLLLYTEELSDSFKFSTDIMPLTNQVNFGVYASYFNENNYLKVSINLTLLEISITQKINGNVTIDTKKCIQNDFVSSETITVTVKRVGEKLTAIIGTNYIFNFDVEMSNKMIGWFCCGKTMFSNIRITQI